MTTTLVAPGYFRALADDTCRPAPGLTRVSLALAAEMSDFVRFNRSTVRQATHVTQGIATLALVREHRRIEANLTLSGRLEPDLQMLRDETLRLASMLDDVADDPHLLLPDATHSERHETGSLPKPNDLVDTVHHAAHRMDFVGFYAGGSVVRAYADSAGARHWHHVENFRFDWCLCLATDKAVKSEYAGTVWRADEFAARVENGAAQLKLLAQSARRLQPGRYRAYFAPAAMNELLCTLSWSGFSGRERHSGTSSLTQLARGDVSLNPALTLCEDFASGIAPAFSIDGFARPAAVTLIESGRAADTLNSPRTAREHGLDANGADDEESPQALRLETGTLAHGEVLRTLDTGLYISNLWYLNYSDRQTCRMTGMTRFACFWVERGKLAAPLDVMRFDDSIHRMFGEGLLGLSDRAELLSDGSTYEQRMLRSVTTPGALVADWPLVL